MATKKSSLDLLIALGGPKSRNSEGQTSTSIASPDQGGDMMAPGGEMVEEEVETEAMPNSIMLPPGFKLPEGVEDGDEFSTTIRATKMGDHLMVKAVGDMPVGEGAETMADEMAESPEEQEEEMEMGTEEHPEAAAYAMKKKDEAAANKAFKS